MGDGSTTAPRLTTNSSSSPSSSSSRASEKLPGSGFRFASLMPVPRPVLEPSSWASSSSAAARAGERRGVWAAEEERLGAAGMMGAESAWGYFVSYACACAYGVHTMQCNATQGQGASKAGMRKQRDVREAAGRVRGGALTP